MIAGESPRYNDQAPRDSLQTMAAMAAGSQREASTWGPSADLIDDLLAQRDEPCGRSIPELVMKAISWLEKVAGFSEEIRATRRRTTWATKDKLVEILSKGAPLTKRAPRFPVAVLVAIQQLVLEGSLSLG